MKSLWAWTCMVAILAPVPAAHAGMFDGLGESIGKGVANRLQKSTDNAVDKTLNNADNAVNCAAGDDACKKKAAAAAAAAPAPAAAAAPAAAKCVATDVGCLREAKARGQTVDIVEESELDTLRCSSRDTACLGRARKLGKKVEITD
jgi:hypothetical protein